MVQLWVLLCTINGSCIAREAEVASLHECVTQGQVMIADMINKGVCPPGYAPVKWRCGKPFINT